MVEKTFLWLLTYEKLVRLISHEGNAHSSHSAGLAHTRQKGALCKANSSKSRWGVEQRELPPLPVVVGIGAIAVLWKAGCKYLSNLDIHDSCDPVTPFFSLSPHVHQKTCARRAPTRHSANEQLMYGISRQRNKSRQQWKWTSIYVCDNINRSREQYYVTKTRHEEDIFYNSVYIKSKNRQC